MAEPGDANSSDLPMHLAALASDVHSKLKYHKNAYSDYLDMHNCLHRDIEEREKLQQEQKEFLLRVAAKEKLIKKNEEQAAEIESLKEKLQTNGSRHANELYISGFQHNLPKGVQTRSMQKRKWECQGHESEEVDEQELMEDMFDTSNHKQNPSTELEDLNKEMGFLDIDNGGRNIGIKNMGKLNVKPFFLACLEKVPRKEAETEAYKLCHLWQEQLMNTDWNPFKTVTVGDTPEEIIDADADRLQELHATWGENAYKAVVNGLKEMKGCCRLSDRTIVPVLWNFKEKRKATPSEGIEYLCSQVKRLSNAKIRISRRKRGHGGRNWNAL